MSASWIFRLAWRDARHHRRRLALMLGALIAGVAAMVLLDLLNTGLQQQLNDNARELLGADMVVNASRRPEPVLQKVFDSLPYPQATEVSMASMVMFTRDSASRLIRLVAYTPGFPFYGKLETLPTHAAARLHEGGLALIDESLAMQFGAQPGDTVKLGKVLFRITGVVKKLPGGGGILSTLTPSVYISMNDIDRTGLIQFGSRVDYRYYFKTTSGEQAEKLAAFLRPLVRRYGYGFDDVAERRRELGRAFESVYRFFSLLAFVSLVLGGMGIAASIHLYATEKRADVALLRVVGAPGMAAFLIYFLQAMALGLLGSVTGVLLGLSLYLLTPLVLNDLLPLTLNLHVSWQALGKGFLLGLLLSGVFAAWPLMSVRFVPPLAAIRPDFQPGRVRSKARFTMQLLALAFPFGLAWVQTGDMLTALFFMAGLAVALSLLYLLAWILLASVKKYFPVGAPFVWRHALSGLYRSGNQTWLLTVTLGLSAFLLGTLNAVEESLLSQVEFTGRTNQSNTILFDIQPHQKDSVVGLLSRSHLPLRQLVPIVTCRITELKGRGVEAWQNDTINRLPNWALTREYRVTYRDSLHLSEQLVRGELQRHRPGQPDSVWITISEGMDENLQVDVDDTLVFDVQGVPLKARISGIRKVEWPKDPPNFIFVFPSGVLEQAPRIYVAATSVGSEEQAARLQLQLISSFPNVSVIDLRLVLSTINELFNKVGGIISALALFSLAAGLVVLAGMVLASRFVRQRENVLLRTLGATSATVTGITLIEYLYIGLFATATGMGLALGGGYAVAVFFFDINFAFRIAELVTVAGIIVLLTVAVGWLNTRQILYTPPLEILRKE